MVILPGAIVEAVADDRPIKLVMLGYGAVGKSNLLLRFGDDSFNPSLASTIGVDFRIMHVNGRRIHIWDTAGQERFRSITLSYLRDAMGVVIVFDVTDRRSFDVLPMVVSDIDRHAPGCSRILVANKTDASDRRVVSAHEAEVFARTHQMALFETSAASGDGVHDAFLGITSAVVASTEAAAVCEHHSTTAPPSKLPEATPHSTVAGSTPVPPACTRSRLVRSRRARASARLLILLPLLRLLVHSQHVVAATARRLHRSSFTLQQHVICCAA
jgi:small GTP-binding protein